MKDSEFKELLNLYLDHEISAADAGRLEAEVLNRPDRRRLYQDYCRMQKACKLLAQDFATAPAVDPERKIIAFAEPAPRHTGWFAAGGLLAAAACVVVVFTYRSHEAVIHSAPALAVQPAVRVAPSAGPAAAAAALVASERVESRPRLVGALKLADNAKQAAATRLFVDEDQAAGAQFEWMHTLQLPPVERVSIANLKFDTQPKLQPGVRPANGNGTLLDGPLEFNAISFQRGR